MARTKSQINRKFDRFLMMFLAWSFCLLLASDSSAQDDLDESPQNSSFKWFLSDPCFPNSPITHYVCPTMKKNIVPPIVLIFSYSCKRKREKTTWLKSLGVKKPTSAVAEQIADEPLTIKDPSFRRGQLVTVEWCSTCLGFTVAVNTTRDEGLYSVKVVGDDKQEVTSPAVKINPYDPKSCPSVDSDPLTITLNSQPLTEDILLTVDDTVELEFLLPGAEPDPKAAVYVAQEDLAYVRHQVRHTCDLKTRRCGAKVKMGNRVVPKVFYRDEQSTKIQIILMFRYLQMKPIQFRRHLKLINPDFEEGKS